jgi:hypothetical protein
MKDITVQQKADAKAKSKQKNDNSLYSQDA